MESPDLELGVKRYKGFSARYLSVKKSSQTGPWLEKQNAPFGELRCPERKTHSIPMLRRNALSCVGDVFCRIRLHLSTSTGRPGQRIEADRRGPGAGVGVGFIFKHPLALARGPEGGARRRRQPGRLRPPLAERKAPTDSGRGAASIWSSIRRRGGRRGDGGLRWPRAEAAANPWGSGHTDSGEERRGWGGSPEHGEDVGKVREWRGGSGRPNLSGAPRRPWWPTEARRAPGARGRGREE